MSIEVILMSNVEGLGAEGDLVHVADGYARNYLLPRNLAAPVTEATRRRLEKRRRERATQQAHDLESAQSVRTLIEQTSCTIAVKTGPEGKLFGSVAVADILASLKEQGIVLGKHQVGLEEPLRELGVFNVPIKLHPEVEASLKVWVVEE
ncbi:MAG: 50S ribosomal protein L9 [Kiritimatiellae bacterium]|nr:50S ribosomal protein L9 [Kiritimatiellia bacterium]